MKVSDQMLQMEVEICNRIENTNQIEFQKLEIEIRTKICPQKTIVALKTLTVIPLKAEKKPIQEVKIPEDKIILILHDEVN